MEKCRRIFKKIFFLPPFLTVLFSLFGYGFVLVVAVCGIDNIIVQCLSYVCSAYALVLTVTGFFRFSSKWVQSVKQYISTRSLVKRLRSTKIGGQFFEDVHFRTKVSLYLGLCINFFYIGIKLFWGIKYRSVWFLALAAYYFLLAVMRLILLRKPKTGKTQMRIELSRYRICGIMLLLMNQALAGIVSFMVYQNKSFDYPGMLIYVMAAYSFCAIITAVTNLIRFRKHASPVLSAAKAVNLVAAMVSMLSLETAMLSQFDRGEPPYFQQLMTSCVGGGVCTIVIGMAVFMICKSTRHIKYLK